MSFAITEYDSGEQLCEEQSALEACQILFLDINMQGMDGLKTAMRIKEKYPKLPVVLVTAYMNYALDIAVRTDNPCARIATIRTEEIIRFHRGTAE